MSPRRYIITVMYRIKNFASLDAVIGELLYRFQGKDICLVCHLERLCLNANVSYETMQTIATYYNIEINMLETGLRLFKKFLESHENIVVKAASDVTEVLHGNQLCDLIPLFSKLASIFAFFPASSKTAE